MGKETIRVSFPVPQSGVQASPLLQRLRGLLPASHQVLQLRLAALLFRRQAQQLLIVARSPGQRLLELRRLVLLRGDLPLVGGVGVMNIMLVTVTERTAEIGLKKAIGAKRRRILAQFLTEASVLTGIGGLLGVLGGIGMSQLISKFMDTPTALSVPAILVAVVFSVLIGLIFGLVPAVKASKLNPIEALRRE